MIKQQLGNKIRELRKARGYSQEQFAPICGLDRTYIAGIESGKRNITIENAQKLANALNVSMSELFDFTQPIHKTFIVTINGEEFILEASKELTPEIKDEIEIIARLAFDEEDSTLLEVSDCDTTDELLELSVFDIAGLLAKKIESDLQISVTFKPIELEVTINY